MTREMGVFPYSEDGIVAPATDATLSSVPTGRDTDIAYPEKLGPPFSNTGAIIPSQIGDTDYIYCNSVWHPVLAGDS